MSFGIQCSNSSGFTQIDATFDNVAVFASGTMNSSFYNGTLTKTSFPANTPSDYLIFCKPNSTSGTKTLTLATFTDGTGFAFFEVFGSTTTSSVDWVIAIRSRDMPANNNPDFGLEVYKQNGEEAFSSNNQNFRCLQVSFDTIVSANQSGATFSLGSMTNIYSLMNGKTIIGRLQTGFNQSVLYSLFVQFNFTSQTIKSVGSPVSPSGPGSSVVGGGYKTNLIGVFG